MKNFFFLFLTAVFLLISSCSKEDLDKFNNPGLTDEEIAEGLKEALKVGTDTSTSRLSRTNGYYRDLAVKILLPAEINTSIQNFKSKSFTVAGVTITGQMLYNGYQNNLLGINIPGLKSKEDELIKGINRAAESAATEAGPIFITAITSISIQDAYNILFGGDNTAATSYLKSKTYNNLYDLYNPKIDNALDKVRIGSTSVTEYYESFVTDYNAILNTSILGTTVGTYMDIQTVSVSDLSAYATDKGLDGLFLKISEEEADIRQDPLARVNSILQKVFGELD